MGIPHTGTNPDPGRGPENTALGLLRMVFPPFLLTRLGLLLVGWLAVELLGDGPTGAPATPDPGDRAPVWIELWACWDSGWYLLIAEKGYGALIAGDVPEPLRPTDTFGFFPLYPALIRALSTAGLPPIVAGILISNGALLLALVLLAVLLRKEFGEPVARRAVWALLAFPTSLFFSAVYAESLLLCCATGALLLARGRRPLAAGLVGGLCTLSRPVGVLIVIPLFSEIIGMSQRETPRDHGRGRDLTACFLPAGAALIGFMLYGRAVTGSFSAFIERQIRWRGEPSGPWRALQRYFEDPALHDAHHSTIDLAIAVLMIASIPFLFRLLPRSYALYGTAMIVAPLGTTLWSFSRLAAVIFPVHVALAVATQDRRRWFGVYLALALPLAAILMARYATWRWAG